MMSKCGLQHSLVRKDLPVLLLIVAGLAGVLAISARVILAKENLPFEPLEYCASLMPDEVSRLFAPRRGEVSYVIAQRLTFSEAYQDEAHRLASQEQRSELQGAVRIVRPLEELRKGVVEVRVMRSDANLEGAYPGGEVFYVAPSVRPSRSFFPGLGQFNLFAMERSRASASAVFKDSPREETGVLERLLPFVADHSYLSMSY